MRVCLVFILVVGLFFVAPVSVEARGPVVKSGERVRVFAPRIIMKPVEGTVDSSSAEIFTFVPDGSVQAIEMPLSLVLSLEVRRGQKNRMVAGAWMGTLIGAGIMMAADAFTTPEHGEAYDFMSSLTTFGIGGAAGGLLIGALIGAGYKTGEHWDRINLDRFVASVGQSVKEYAGIRLTILF